MGDLTKNISRHEIACQCGCGEDTIDWEVVHIVQSVANHFAFLRGKVRVVVRILSGCRCKTHNENEGGAEDSMHLEGKAIDFAIDGVHPHVVYDYLNREFPDRLGLGRYASFTHVDVRPGPARW